MKRGTKVRLALLLGTVIAFAAGGSVIALADGGGGGEGLVLRAVAKVRGAEGSGIRGTVSFLQAAQPRNLPTPTVLVVARIRGLTPGLHGFHIHENGGCEPVFEEAGGHFDAGPYGHSTPVDLNHPYHSGDLPNLRVNERGVGRLIAPTTRITVSDGPLTIFDHNGSAVIVHANEDRGLPGVTGASGGPRVACGVIERVEVEVAPEEEEEGEE